MTVLMQAASGELRIVEPGLFVSNDGPMTPMGLLVSLVHGAMV